MFICLLYIVFANNAIAENKNNRRWATSHRDLYAPNRLFSRNTALKSHGRRQPCRGFLSCLAEKPLTLECFAVLRIRFFLTGVSRERRNTVCISRTMDFSVGKKIDLKPHQSLCESAQGCPLLIRLYAESEVLAAKAFFRSTAHILIRDHCKHLIRCKIDHFSCRHFINHFHLMSSCYLIKPGKCCCS